MRFIKSGLFYLSTLLLLLTASCNTPNSNAEVILIQDSTLKSARISKTTGFKAEALHIELIGLSISADSYGNLVLKSGGKSFRKAIDLGKGFYTHAIHYYDNAESVALFFETMDSQGSYNKVYCLNKETGQTEWQTTLGNFSLSVGQAENNILYLGSSENVYALNLKTGKLIWQTEGLYHLYGFNYYDSIAVTPTRIKLIGETQSSSFSRDKETKTVSINKQSGKIQAVKLADSPESSQRY